MFIRVADEAALAFLRVVDTYGISDTLDWLLRRFRSCTSEIISDVLTQKIESRNCSPDANDDDDDRSPENRPTRTALRTLALTEGIPFVNVSNVLSEQKKQQVIALGRLRWTLRRIERETGVRRETAAAYLKAAGVAMRPPGGWGRRPPAEPAKGVTTDSSPAKPANGATTGSGGQLLNQPAAEQEAGPQRSPSASACEAYREAIEVGLSKGRNAMAFWQDLLARFLLV